MDGARAPGLYIHIPFCSAKCGYCDFYSSADTSLIPGFLDALFSEMDLCRAEEKIDGFDTLYLGGGTPSLLTPVQIGSILEKAFHTFTILPGAEITVEMNPADWSRRDLSALRETGVNRVTIGVQSLDEGELRFLGRRHDRRQALSAVEWAIAAGFDNIGVDLIYGLPGQGFGQWGSSLRQALELSPAHLSCYELELKPCTPLGLKYGQAESGRRADGRAREFFVKTSEILEGSGYIHYEVSNFAAGMDRVSRHNRKYWDHTPYLGLGPSAHSFRGSRRWWNHASLRGYLADLKERRRPIEGSEELEREQLALEAMFLGLRTREGIDLEHYRRRYGRDLAGEKASTLREWIRSGLVRVRDGRVRPTLAGMAVADSLAAL